MNRFVLMLFLIVIIWVWWDLIWCLVLIVFMELLISLGEFVVFRDFGLVLQVLDMLVFFFVVMMGGYCGNVV